ncbi:DUF6912 family protein [Cellulomonas fengjieae]|uniref:Uncharacterized protein n=1 Tax=Cellulomonas fengjieae TaxID=2819978 RepID=A0ABS3SDR2_9CELL|nr:hypothetical protein [Cellulomonas fengjieae]MBO3083898.1 hypothetical protein [Cellulomonas fengjieae]MBO3101350.1 hypothetical protein [Cellulomonas fengjieae]QVI64819.1 hypothetical protein KG102_11700 [Cellulomonas fengjieae]
MRIYLPASLDQLDPAAGPFAARRAHAVTPALRAMFPDEDDEGLEFAAQLAAADDSLELLGARPDAPQLRLVVSVDVPDGAVREVSSDDDVPSAVELTQDVPQSDVICVHVDEPAAAGDVVLAAAGDDAAVDRLDERDLLWYDASELGQIPR